MSIFYLNKAVAKMIKICKLNKLLYKMMPNIFLSINEQNITDARSFLEAYSPDPQTSCFCKNDIDIKVDLHIIVPAYNAEKYIKECLDSIGYNSTQKYTYHVTVVNDGSTDCTADVLSRYLKNPTIEIITQTNKGFSGARNTALKHIKGRYVMFLDSDDCLDWIGVEKLLDCAIETGADIVEGSHTTINAVGKKKSFFKTPSGVVEPYRLGGQPWSKVFKAELFASICFPEKYWYEDSVFSQIVYPKVKCAYSISDNTYFYRLHGDNISYKSRNYAKSIDSYWITEKLFNERQKAGFEITQDYYNYILYMVKLTFPRIMFQNKKVKQAVFILFYDFINKNFSNYTTDDKKLKEIENIVITKNYGKCVAYSKWR